MMAKVRLFNQEKIDYGKFFEIFQGWDAYAKWGNTYNLRGNILRKINV